jgi:hypothetical protein
MKTLSYSASALTSAAIALAVATPAFAEDVNTEACSNLENRTELRMCLRTQMNVNNSERKEMRTEQKQERKEMQVVNTAERKEAMDACKTMHAELKASVNAEGMVAFADVEALLGCMDTVRETVVENRTEVRQVQLENRSTKMTSRTTRNQERAQRLSTRANLKIKSMTTATEEVDSE